MDLDAVRGLLLAVLLALVGWGAVWVLSHERRDEEVASKVRLLEREKAEATARMEALEREMNEAVAKTKALEREVGELVSLITLASEEVAEILKVGAKDEISQPQADNVPTESRSLGQLGESPADPQKELK